MRVHDFLLQQIYLVEEQNHRGVFEPLVGDDCPEQGHAFLHAVLCGGEGDRQDTNRASVSVDAKKPEAQSDGGTSAECRRAQIHIWL